MRSSFIALTAALAALAAPAFAQDAAEAPASDFTITGSVTAVTDYRFRGVSLSDENPAIQSSVNLNHSSGFYVGTWTSNLEDTDLYGELEIDLYAGWTGEVAPGTVIDAQMLYYYYPDGEGDSDYFEPYITIAQTIGPVTAKAGANYAISSDATGNDDFLYLFGQLSAGIPNTPVTITGKLGHQDFGNVYDDYWDWSIGGAVTFGPVTAGISYVSTNIKSGRPGAFAAEDISDDAVVGSLSVAF